MKKILYILLPSLLALATPSSARKRRKISERQRYEQYQQPTYDQTLSSKSSNTLIKSSGVYLGIVIISVVCIISFLLFDIFVLKGPCISFAFGRFGNNLNPSLSEAIWKLIQFMTVLIGPGLLIGGLISIPLMYFVFDSSDSNDEETSTYGKKRRPMYRY